MKRRLKMRQIEILMRVAKLGSISKASEELHVAQPALSRQIKMMEEDLGVQLFERLARGMVPTQAGELVVQRAPRIIRQLDDLRSDIMSMAGEITGDIAFGAPPALAEQLVGDLIEPITSRFSKVSLRVVTSFSGHVANWLQSGEIDLAVLYAVPKVEGLITEDLLNEHQFLVGGPDAGLSLDQPVPFEELADLKLVLPSHSHATRRVIDNAAIEKRTTLDVRVEADSVVILKHLVRKQAAHTILPMASIYSDLQEGTLSAAPITSPKLICRLVLAAAPERLPSVLMQHFADALRDEVDRMIQSGVWIGDRPAPSAD